MCFFKKPKVAPIPAPTIPVAPPPPVQEVAAKVETGDVASATKAQPRKKSIFQIDLSPSALGGGSSGSGGGIGSNVG